jgi:3-oxoacyl-[acyl-carrier protein] reductase
MSQKSPEQRVVFVTGGGIGIGRAASLAFARAGDHVVITDVLTKAGRETVTAVDAAGGSAEFIELDVRSTSHAEAAMAQVITKHGRVDVVVANAGIARRVPIDALTDEKWDETMDVDLKGMLRVIRPALPPMRAARAGAIVCLSSIMGVAYGWDEHVHYSAAKAGVVGLVRGLAVELAGQGIRVNGVAPGYIRTAQLLSEQHSLGPAGAEKAAAFIPMGRLGEPEDIADVICFLASSAARYLTGQVLTVDGGLLVGRY